MTIARSALWPVLLSVALLAPRGRAHAAMATDDEAMARAKAHFAAGQTAYEAGRFDEAFAEYEAGWKLSARPGFLYNMAQAKRGAGDLRAARGLLRTFLAEDPDAPQRDEVIKTISDIDVTLDGDDDGAPGLADADADAAPAEATSEPDATSEPEATTIPDVVAAPPDVPPAVVMSAPVDAEARPVSVAPPLYKRRWFWGATGAAVVGAVLVAAFASGSGASDGSSATGAGSLGTLRR